ncbi:tRNA pseudouridine(55) synthase TruB [Halalkalibacter sp. APA_J-10(15)]|uniref:tRNA pseudouridine(55) synthase TruB n=1 Tax=Halalkalibacter sp. APA_J-10(15) TaxID=2933805 RepID=UPI001FF2C78D|nr:tRNA pseudouridine(55) synthase TruB [Halalkalibacter sp. APA_J-10(15)]MCK0470797.1 tRNA pseudouridine(55) synthase TruB [Halalkalibacter sp. APA_J-10(15)]
MEQSGILVLHKPRGYTSHDCVMKIRRIFQTKKVGHTGTLDPDVNGVLPICIGKGTKVVEYMSGYEKEYNAELTIGYSTTTEDRSGDILESQAVTETWTKKEMETVLDEFVGHIVQVPPMYSAVKVNGKRLYAYAREGKVIERPKRHVQIKRLQLISDVEHKNNQVLFRFNVLCSKGTYVRTLAVDIGKRLGYPAHMSDLVRIGAGPYKLEDSFTFEQLESLKEKGSLHTVLQPFETAINHFPKVVVATEVEPLIKNGAVIPFDHKWSRFSVYNEAGECLAIYKEHPEKEGKYKPEKMFWIGGQPLQ